MSKKAFRVGLVGCGVIAPNHLDALKSNPLTEVVALCDVKLERAKRRNEEFSLGARLYENYTEMLDTESLDAVHIATPHYLHAPMTIEALKRGINVFLEKPMCINQEQINDMLRAEKESSATVCVCFQNRFIVAFREAMRLIEEDGGAIGAFGSVFWERTVPYYTESGWRGSYATEGGGVMINQAIHTIDMLCQILGTPKKLWATKANHHLKGVIEVEDTCEGLVEFENGKRANFYATTSFHGRDNTSVVVITKNHRIEISPPRLSVDFEWIDLNASTNYIGKECYGAGHPILINRFYEALRDGEPTPVSLESAMHAVKILLAAYKSGDEETLI